MLRREGSKGRFDLIIAAAIQNEKLLSDRTRRFRHVLDLHLAYRLIWICQ